MCRLRVFVSGRWWPNIWGHEHFFILCSSCSFFVVLQGSLVRVMASREPVAYRGRCVLTETYKVMVGCGMVQGSQGNAGQE